MSLATQLKQIFRNFDQDKHSTIPKEKLVDVLRKLDDSFTDEELDCLFEQADKNGDGVIQYEEFVDFICFLDGGVSDTGDSSPYEYEDVTRIGMMTGKIQVGPKHEKDAKINTNITEESKRLDIDFGFDFGEPPIVIVSAQGQPGQTYPDGFGSTVVNVTSKGCQVNVGRQHNEVQSWGQDPALNWLAVKNCNTEMLRCGTVDVGPYKVDDDQTKEFEIKFHPAFPVGHIPVVACTALSEDFPDVVHPDTGEMGVKVPDTFSCTIRRLSRKRAIMRVARTCPKNKQWGQNLKVNWIATTMFPAFRIEVGSKPEDGVHELVKPNVEFLQKYSHEPTIFCMPQHERGSSCPDVFAVTPANVENDKLQLNMGKVHETSRGWGMNLYCHIFVIP